MVSDSDLKRMVKKTPKKIIKELHRKYELFGDKKYRKYALDELKESSHPPNGLYRLTDEGWMFDTGKMDLRHDVDHRIQTSSQALNILQIMIITGHGVQRWEIQDILYTMTNELAALSTEIDRGFKNLKDNKTSRERFAELLGIKKPKEKGKPGVPLIEFVEFPNKYQYALLKRDYGIAADIVLEGMRCYGNPYHSRDRRQKTAVWEVELPQLPDDDQYSIVIETAEDKNIKYYWMINQEERKEVEPFNLLEDFLPAYRQKIVAEKRKLGRRR